jgi:Ca-activated chloride channel family protein
MPLGANEQEKIAQEAYGEAMQEAMPAIGADAVERAAGEGAMRQADVVPAIEPGQNVGGADGASGVVIRNAGNRTFLYRDGVWIDTTYDPDRMDAQQVQFLSEAYFDLLDSRPELAPALALGDQVMLVVDGQAFAVVREGGAETVRLPALLPTSTGEPLHSPAPTRTATAAPAGDAAAPTAPAQLPDARPDRGALCLGAFLPLAMLLAAVGWLRSRP